MIWFFYLALATPLSSATTEYYHEFSKKIFSISTQNSYFGYSIAYESESKTLIVSAPLSNIAGDVFLCNIYNDTCVPIKSNLTLCTENKKGGEHMWMGAVVKSAPSYYVTCAPRCIKADLNLDPIESITEGHCSIGRSSNLTYPKPLEPISVKNRYAGYYRRVENAMLTFGWSIDVFEKSIVVGGPAMLSGRLEKYSTPEVTPKYVGGDDKGVRYNFGYSVASGYFIKDEVNIFYAVGSTYGTHGYGKVVLLSRELDKKADLVKDEIMHKSSDYQVGAMYGSVLCTASFTGKMTDLLVGAPTYTAENQQNTGAVYVYVRGKSNMPMYKRTIFGENDKSHFGSAIVSIEDLNNDAKDEFAIAAPYEADGRGAVYLYSGADVLRLGKPFHPLQKILPEDNWRTFGLSLSSLQDYDDNGCNELAIGAPESDRVLLLRCMASIYVTVFIQVPDLKNSNTTSGKPARKESFEYQSCLNVTYPKKPKDIKATIQIKGIIRHQGAKLKNPEQATYEVSLHDKNDTYCKSIEVLTPEIGNYDMEIDINVTASHKDNPIKERTYDSSGVILSDNSVLSSNVQVWAAKCTGNNRCMPDFNYMKTIFSVSHENYVIGSSPTITATIWLENHGEVAYDACVHLQIFGVSVLTSPAGCERKDDQTNYSWLKCSPKQLIRTGETWNTTQIILDTTLLTNIDKEITIKGAIYDHCKDSNNSKIFKETIHLVSDTDGVTVRGSIDYVTENNVYISKSDIAVGKVFEHVYEISNNGPTTWVDIDFQVKVQQLPYIDYDVTIQINGAESKCEKVKLNENTSHLIYKCRIEKLSKYPIEVLLPMRVKPGVLGDMLENGNNLTVYSELTFNLQTKEKKSASITSMLTKLELSVPLWIMICTAILGLFILFIFGFILRELGLLKRKNRDKLERVRKSVRRQTVMRQQSQNERIERERVNSAEIQSMLAEAAKEKHDRRLRLPSTE